MGAAHERPAPKRLLREHSSRRDGRRSIGRLRHLLRHDRGTGLLLARRRRSLVADRPRPAGGAVGRSANAQVTNIRRRTMKFMCLGYYDEKAFEALSDAERNT